MRTNRQTDRQTDMAKLIVAFRNFAKAPKKLPPPRERERKREREQTPLCFYSRQHGDKQRRASLRRERRSGRMTIITQKETW